MKTGVFAATWIVVMQPAALAATRDAGGGHCTSRIERVFFSKERNQQTSYTCAGGPIRDLAGLVEPAGK